MSSDRNVRIVISADVAQAIRQLGQVEQGLGGVGQNADSASKKTSTMGDVMKGALAASGIQMGLSGIVDGFKGVVQSGMQFEQAQNQFQAVTGATADQMRAAGEAAKALGNDVQIPGASASSATQAMLELAKGGLTAQQAMDASRGTMILAAAAQIDGAQAAEIQANALNTFGLKADQAGRVANVLANVANKSSGEITDFSQGLAQAGTVASGFGWSIEETTTYLGLMANAGIKGSDAGTSLKTTMTALLNPTNAQSAALEELGVQTRDANGKMISAKDLTAQLAAAKLRMTDADFNAAAATAFGTDAVRTALVAAQAGAQGYDDMAGALTNQSGAADMAAANSKGLSGIIDQLKNAADTASQGLYTALSPALGQITTAATGVIGPLAEGLTPLFGTVADLATGTLAPALEGVSSVLSAVAGPISEVIGWFNELPGPVGGAVLAIGGVIALRGPLNGVITSLGSSVTGIRTSITGFVTSLRTASGAMATTAVAAKGLMGALGGPIGLAIVGVATALSFMGSKSDDAAVATAGLGSAIDENTGKLKDNADAIIAKAAADSGSFDAVEKIGGSVQVYTEALKGNADAQDQMHTLLLDQATAALKNSDAWDRMVAKGLTGGKSAREIASGLLAQGDAGEYSSEQMDAVLAASQAFAADSGAMETAARRNGQAIQVSGTAAGDAATSTLTFDEALKKVQASSQEATATATPFTDALKAMRAAASEADAASQFLYLTLIEMSGGQITAEQATRANEAAFRQIGSAARDYAEAQQKVADKEAELTEMSNRLGTEYKGQVVTQADLDRASRELADAKTAVADADDKQFDAGIKAAQSAAEMASQAYVTKAAQGDLAGGIADATAKMAEQRQKFIDAQPEADRLSGKADELANKLGLIPENVRTTFEQKGGADALKQAQDLNAALDLINNKTVRYFIVEGKTIQLDAPSTTGRGASTTDYLRAQAQGHADGGWITGPGGPRDDKVKARLSPGEFVVNAAQAGKHAGLLEAINAGELGFADGGRVPGGKQATAGAAMAVTAPDASLFEVAWREIGDAAKDAWSQKIKPILEAFSKENTALGDGTQDLAASQVAPAWQQIVGVITAGSQTAGQQQVQLQSVVSAQWAMMAAAQQKSHVAAQAGAYQPWADWSVRLGDAQTKLAGTTSAQWSAISGSVTDAQKGKITPAFDTLNSGSDGVGNRFSALAGTAQAQWSAIAGSVDSAKSGTILPAIDAIGQAAGGLESAFGSAASGIASKWDEIKPGVADPVNWLLGSVWNQGIVGAWDKIKGWLPSISTSLGPLDLVGYATGGPVQGSGTDTSDNILARLSPGEWVVPAAATRQHLDLLKAITPGFATGGPVGWDRVPSLSAAFGGPDQALPDEMTAFVKAFVANPFDTISDLIGEPLVRANQFDHGLPEAMSQAAGEAVGGMIGTLKDMFGLENDGKGGPPKLDGSGTLAMDGVLFVDGEAYALPSGTRGEFLKAVASKMGTPYVWGAAGPDVFDCSGLMSWALAQAGAGVGRRTADDFHKSFPHVAMPGKPGDLATFSARYSKESGMAGHIGAILDTAKGLMMHTDGAGPARVSDYRSREGGPLSIVDALGGAAQMGEGIGELPAIIARVIYGDYGTAAGVGAIDPKDAANFSSWDSTRTLDTLNPIVNYGEKNMARGDMSMVGPLPPGDPINRWAPLAASAFAAKGLGTENVPNLIRQIGVESGGNPLAYNDWDRNYTSGKPSKGLLQTIPSTFAAHAAPGYNTNIWHPPSNFMSAIDYAWGKYGSFPGRAYDKGGVLPPGFSMAYNGTGKYEHVYTEPPTGGVQIDYDRLAKAVTGAMGGRGVAVDVNVNDGAIKDLVSVTARGAIRDHERARGRW